jgi:D-xylonolactonase
MPVRKVTSLTLGGENYGTAFVTTAGGNERGDENGALAGSLFSIDLGVQGKAAFRSRISV